MNVKHVSGEKSGDVTLFALSTCGWCKKTTKLLDDLGVEYDYVYVDLLEGQDKSEAISALKHHNPQRSFPTLVIDNKKCIIGFQEDEIKKALGK